ncbi:UEV domain [Trypanosoma vivax]|uniref:Uncharacterized protein n=1 Tax=Trypanosoma vivax (strain Y486) TaxID=1055687 RepID=G0U8J0_TRYVY|nr:hypothetical protein TRVL_07386 [Trypanosoma vivax]KAH8604999.1 UEV domain [Trypanosoma vivax]KAH8605168.1 UEV domain [Trypanosoma vivax]CCC53916.1 conserved hypothetical protein [Trypanosoma vivax Y486]
MAESIPQFFGRSANQADGLGQVSDDLLALCDKFSLSFRMATWGATKQSKVCVYGGLPISIGRQSGSSGDAGGDPEDRHQYMIPIQIWLTRQYPIDPPLLLLLSTDPGCRVLGNHKYVDVTGRCHTPELAAWKPDSSSLCHVVEDLKRLLEAEGIPPLCVDKGISTSLPRCPSGSPLDATVAGGDDPDCEDDSQCIVCFGPKDTILVPCGHYCFCISCATNVPLCPLCREYVKFRQRVFK